LTWSAQHHFFERFLLKMQSQQKYEIGVSSLITLICLIFLWESWGLPPGTFEPLGSAPVPQATAGIIIFCCILVIRGAFKKVAGSTADEESQSFGIKAAVLIAVATLLFVILLQLRIIPFSWMTAAFLTVTIWGLEKFTKRKFLPAVVTGLIVGFAMQYLFTQVFIVDLPS
jgi:putative tricarboxylic transport membrane protein